MTQLLAVLMALLAGTGGCDAAADTAARAGTHTGYHLPGGRMESYAWLASNSGPKGCPVDVRDGDLFYPGGRLYIPKATLHAGWGQQVSQHLVGDAKKPLPDSGAVLFFSYLEDKLYRLAFALPRDSLERLFREGFRDYSDRATGRGTYDALVVGVAPGGAVAVWAAGTERQTEVFFGQAEVADVDWHRAMGMPPEVNRRAFVAAMLADAAERDPLVPVMQRQLPLGRWATYRTRYRWRPVFEGGLPTPAVLSRVDLVNGERVALELPLDAATARTGLPAPRVLSYGDPGTGRRWFPEFDAEEITAAFARAGAGGHEIELVLAPPPPGTPAPGGVAEPREVVVRGAETVVLRRVVFRR